MTSQTVEGLDQAETMRLTELRRHLHQHPELSFQEHETAALVARELGAIEGVEDIREGIGGTGVTAIIRGAHPGPVLLLRADIDALPIQDAKDVEYASQNEGVLHACGHDAHTAILLTVARILAGRRDRIHGTAFLVFQPAEEVGRGAQAMIDDGIWDIPDEMPKATLGLHMAAGAPSGAIIVVDGPMLAAVDTFEIEIRGRGGHGAMPNQAVDPIFTAAELVLSLQRIVSREISPTEPAVVSVCRINAGTATNIVPGVATLSGTIRTFSEETRQAVADKMERIVSGVCTAGGAEYSLTIHRETPPVINEPEMCRMVREVAGEVVGPEHVLPGEAQTAGDDVGYFMQAAPGCYFFLGGGDASVGITAPHHHPNFDIADESLPAGARVLAQSALRYLSTG